MDKSKVDVPNLVTNLNPTPIFEWYVDSYGSKNGCQKDKCFGEIELHAQNMVTILGLRNSHHNQGNLCDSSMSSRVYTFDNE